MAQTDPMRYAFFAGWGLLIGAFAAAAAETIARTFASDTGWMISAGELWQALWPGAYLISEQRLSQLLPWLWDPVIAVILMPPAWFLLGFPGIILAWWCRPGQNLSPAAEEELREHEASLFLYDELAREARQWARESGEPASHDDDDRLPTHDLVDILQQDGDDIDPFEDVRQSLPDFVKPPERRD